MDEMHSMHLLIHHPEGFAQDYLQLIDKIIHMNKNKITVRGDEKRVFSLGNL
jgi:hypothetical protein